MMFRWFVLWCILAPVGNSGLFAQSKLAPGGWVYMYPMDGHMGDAGVYRNHGWLRGNVQPTQDRFGRSQQALLLDGQSSYIEIPFDRSPDIAPDVFTITAWVYLESYYIGEAWDPIKTYRYAPVFSKSDSTDDFQCRFICTDKGFYFDGGKEKQSRGLFYSGGVTIPLMKWTFVSVTCNGYSLKIFINDRLAASMSGSFAFPSNGKPMLIGVDKPGADEYWKGAIDDVSIWEKYLTEEEIKTIYWTQLKRPINLPIANPIRPEVVKPLLQVTPPVQADTIINEKKDSLSPPTYTIDSLNEFVVSEGSTIVLRHVLFEQSKAVLLPESYEELDKLVTTLQHHPTMLIEVSGHTDNQGNRVLNIQLSEERAQRVKQYLVEKGIDGKRIVCKGFGPDKPISPNFTEDQRRLNRRVEFMILKM